MTVVTVYHREDGLTPVTSAHLLLLIFQHLNRQRNGSIDRAANKGEQHKQITQCQSTITSCLKWINRQYKQ